MSCNHCTTKFNFFHKEVGCANCGLSFCNKCLKQKAKISGKGTTELNVCKACYIKLTAGSSKSQSSEVIIPPDAYLKRLEALGNPLSPPITIYENNSNTATLNNLASKISTDDAQLYERLKKLKDNGKEPPPSEQEIRDRLNKLKGSNNYVPPHLINNPKFVPKDTRTDAEKADNLLEMFSVERDIELSQNPQDEIEARLAVLREKGIRPNEGKYVKDLHDSSSSSEDEVDKITKKIMDEVALDVRCPLRLPANTDTEISNDIEMNDIENSPELPWCILCNNDARFQCLDCNDLYCEECNKEVHKTWGDADHKVILFKRK